MRHFLEPLGHLGADFEKKLQKVAQKDVKKGGAQTPFLHYPGKIGLGADLKKMLKTGVEKYDRKCASSMAPATLLEVRGEKEHLPG